MDKTHETSPDLAHADITEAIIGSFFETVRELGYGYNEKVYCRGVAIVIREKGFEVAEEVPIEVMFHGVIIGAFRADLVVNNLVLVEVKATPLLEPYNEAQLLNYLKAAGGGVGLLLNFGRSAAFKRRVTGNPYDSLPNLRRRLKSASDEPQPE